MLSGLASDLRHNARLERADHFSRYTSPHSAAAHTRSGRGDTLVQEQTVLQRISWEIRLHL